MKRSALSVLPAVVVLLLVACAVSHAQDAKPWEQPGTKAGDEIVGPDGVPMVWVPAGEFTMGSTDADVDAAYHRAIEMVGSQNAKRERFAVEQPTHRVRITKGFWLGKCTVTNAQYRKYCQEAGAHFPDDSDQGDSHPVLNVTWDDAQAYCKRYGLALPTEAQWEYAARGSEGRKYPWGNEWDPKKCCNHWNQGPGDKTFPVGSFPEGASWCGALDMAGNVWQWCSDWYGQDYYANSPDADPAGPDSGDTRVVRGGSWVGFDYACRSAGRPWTTPNGVVVRPTGLRCAACPVAP